MEDERRRDEHQTESALLFGADPALAVVGCEVRDAPGQGGCEALIWLRGPEGVHREAREFRPWLITDRPAVPRSATQTRLEGDGLGWSQLGWLHEFQTAADFAEAREALRQGGAQAGVDLVAYPSLVRQFLVQSGVTFFKGMSFGDVLRMQIDIETSTLSPKNAEARVLMAAVTDSMGFREAVRGNEREILQRLAAIIAERDPDVIEGHNFFGFDLPYLAARASALGLELPWGRDGSPVRFGATRSLPFGGITRPYTPAYILGRSIIDTLFGVQRYDVGRSEMSSYALKEVALQLGIAEPDRVYLDRSTMDRLWKSEPDRVAQYALQDSAETGSLSAIVMPPDFYVTQMAPDSYQANATGGTGEKINLLLVREYLRCRRAIPKPRTGRAVAGGYTAIVRTGLVERVVKCDVESLYPSLMLSRRIAPASDSLGVFLPMLEELTRRRLDAKARKAAAAGMERTYWDGLQSSFKILINSFYGYLGAGFFFNDPDAAEQVTLGGQVIVQGIVAEIERAGGSVVEVDTDGVYFQPPDGVQTQEQEEDLIRRLSDTLPEGINLAHDGRWRAMMSLKVKNYVLIGYDGRRIYKGAALRSRADERYGQEFIARAVDLIADGRAEDIHGLYMGLMERIESGDMRPEEFCRRERVTAKALQGRSLQRAAGALEGASQGDYLRLYRREDGTLARIEDYAGDEDREHLKQKLHKFALRLAPVLGDDMDRLCPRPGSLTGRPGPGQQSLDLFG